MRHHRHNSKADAARRHSPHTRRGVMLVEGALVLSVLITIAIGGIDLALAVMRYNTLSEVSRKLSREAIVHGEQAEKNNQAWGPQTYQATAADASTQASLVRGMIAGVSPASINLRIEWIDGTNALDQRVRVTSSTTYVPLIQVPFLKNSYQLSASSVMRITY